jgi:penicillin-binding protein-related factor A (putative recombinase)
LIICPILFGRKLYLLGQIYANRGLFLEQSADCLRHTLRRNTSEDIAVVLRQKGFDVKVVNAKKDKVKDITK